MNIIAHLIKLLVDLIESVMRFSFEFIEMVVTGIPKKNREYKAGFASASSILSNGNSGFCLTGNQNLSVKHSYQNALIIGGTGTGKSSVVLIPSLFTMNSSFIVHDPSGELIHKSAGYLKSKGYEIKILNFTSPEFSIRYNPLIRANNSSDIQKVASLLIEISLGKGKEPFWNTQAVALLSIIILILKKQDSEFQNLYNVRQLLNRLGSDNEAVDLLFSRYADETLFSEYKSFLAYDEKVVNGVIATCKAALQIFSDESVASVTSDDSLEFSDLRNKPVALFIQNSVADQRYYSVITSLFFEQFFSYLLSRFPEKDEKDIFLLIDEASSLNLPTLPLAVANVRKHHAGIMLLIQDFAQLIHHYGQYDSNAIKANCFAKMYFTGQSLESAKELEQTLGKYEYKDVNNVKVIRPLMTNDEIRIMKNTHALIICGNHRPVMAKLTPYYKKSTFRTNSEIVFQAVQTDVQELNVLPLTLFAVKENEESPA